MFKFAALIISNSLNKKAMKWKDQTILGSVFPDSPIQSNLKISFSTELIKEYIPTIDSLQERLHFSNGLKYLLIAMTNKEGFKKGTRSYRTNNPGNIGNTDTGKNSTFQTLEEGIEAQLNYVKKVIEGKHKAFPLGKEITIKPYYSAEIAKNEKTYGISPYLPGYKFTYSGQLDQFVKIYSTGARAGNNYINFILSYFENLGYNLTPETTLAEIEEIN